MSTSINFDGVNHDVDSVIATLISKERKAYDSKIESLEENNKSLADEKTQLNSQIETLQGELDATKTKLSELENTDSSGIVSDCISAWSEVLPSIKAKLPKFDADYSLLPPDIKRTYLKAVHDKDLFDKSDDYVNGVYDGLKPNENTLGNVAKEKAIAQFHNLDRLEPFGSENGQNAIAKAREDLIKAKENAWTTLGGK